MDIVNFFPFFFQGKADKKAGEKLENMEKNIKKQARKVEKLQESLEKQIYRHPELWLCNIGGI